MANYKSRKAKPRRTSRRHSTSGKILSPLDVRSKNSLGEFKKRIKAGPITIIMVYADWCGHCHKMMPHFDAASASNGRSVQSIKLNETMMSDANAAINSINAKAKSIEVDGYPSIIAVDNQGNVVATPNAVKNTETMTKLMNQSGNLAVQAGLNNVTMNDVQNRMSIRQNNNAMNIVNNTVENQLPNAMNVNAMNVNSMNSYKGEDVGSIVPITNIVEPGTIEGDLESISNLSNNNKKASTIRGGSLYASLAQTTYTLAPTAALLASAAFMMNNKRTKRAKRTKRTKRSTRKNKKTHKRH